MRVYYKISFLKRFSIVCRTISSFLLQNLSEISLIYFNLIYIKPLFKDKYCFSIRC